MNDAFVADCSASIAWAVESQSDSASELLLDEIASGRPFVVPVLWHFEVSNALIALMRRKRIDRDYYVRAAKSLSRLMPVVDEEGPKLALGNIAHIADLHGLSVSDAAYLELAVRRDLPLASRDAGLNRAARKFKITTLL